MTKTADRSNRIAPWRKGNRLRFIVPPPIEPDVPRHFGILLEDEYILAVDKPAGLPVHPTARYHLNTLTALLRERYGENRPILAHRIDSETSGVLLCAKTKEAERALKIMFADRRIQKQYLAVVRGIPSPQAGKIEASLDLDKNSPIRIKMACCEDGLPSLTEYRVIKTFDDRALVECHPRTGRQHQIRVHLTHLGYPIIGDKIYGPDESLFLDYLEQGLTPEIEQRAGAKRQALHAASISLIHPMTKETLVIESPLPADMNALIQ